MREIDLKKVMEWLGFILRCPVCQYRYNLNQTKVLRSSERETAAEARILVHSDCARCKSSVMFNIEIRGPEVLSQAVVTDLTGRDTGRFTERGAITADEVIGIHQAIRSLKGGFTQSLKDRAKKV